MANVKISELPKETIISNTDVFPFNKGTTTSSVTFDSFKNNLSGSYIPKPSPPANGSVLTYNNNVWEGQDIVTSILNLLPKKVAKIKSFKNSILESFTETTFLPVKANRTAGSLVVTINYSGLPSKYKDPNKPFFIKGQYIGVTYVSTKIRGNIYKIVSHDYTNHTFTINTFPTEATGAMANHDIFLTCIYDNVDETDTNNINIKSIYQIQPGGNPKGKFYVNFIQDLYTKSRTNSSPVEIPNSDIIINGTALINNDGSKYRYAYFNLLYDVYKTSNDLIDTWDEDRVIGFGATSMGISVSLNYGGDNIPVNPIILDAYLNVTI